MVVAMSSESAELVEPYVESMGIPFPVASGSESNGTFSELSGSRGIPHAYLIDGEGVVAWHGHPAGLSGSKIEKVLKASRSKKLVHPSLALNVSLESEEVPKKALGFLSTGELGKGWAALQRDLENQRATPAELAAAGEVQAALQQFT